MSDRLIHPKLGDPVLRMSFCLEMAVTEGPENCDKWFRRYTKSLWHVADAFESIGDNFLCDTTIIFAEVAKEMPSLWKSSKVYSTDEISVLYNQIIDCPPRLRSLCDTLIGAMWLAKKGVTMKTEGASVISRFMRWLLCVSKCHDRTGFDPDTACRIMARNGGADIIVGASKMIVKASSEWNDALIDRIKERGITA